MADGSNGPCACGGARADAAREAYPWDECISDNEAKYGAEDAAKICGFIKSKYGSNAARAIAAQRATRRGFSVGAIDESTRSVQLTASTAAPLPTVVPGKDGQPEEAPLSIESWNLERFAKSPVVLWAHSPTDLPIGRADNVQQGPDGLSMRITIASERANPKAEQIWQGLREGIIRGVSVGFGPGDDSIEDRDGKQVVVRRNAELREVSLVPVGQDEDALVGGAPAVSDDELRQRRISSAGRDLAGARKVRTDGLEEVDRFDFAGSLDKFERTPVGGLKIPARISRTGVLKYTNPDGSERRELRLPAEAFRKDSLATLEDAPVTDLAHHRGLLDTTSWKGATLGHVKNVRADGGFISAELAINDADTISSIERGELSECSAGYRCALEPTSGVHNGERYDAIQRDIKYNHVAVLPPGRGRAGSDVGLRLDSSDDPTQGKETMAEPATKTLIRLDGKEFEYGSQAHVAHLEARYDASEKAHEGALKTKQAELDTVQAKLDAAEKTIKKAAEDAVAIGAQKDKQFRSRANLILRALRVLSDEGSEDMSGTNMDAKEGDMLDKLVAMNDRDVQIQVIRTDADFKDFDGKEKSDDYVSATYDIVSKKKIVERRDSVDAIPRLVERIRNDGNGNGNGGGGDDPEETARKKMYADAHSAHLPKRAS